MMYFLTISMFAILMALEIPIAVAIGFTVITVFFVGDIIPLTVVPQYLYENAANYGLIAAPLFILAGQFMEKGGTSQRLVNFALSLVGRFRGGLSYATIVASMFMGGISGSAIADTSAIGSITVPAMVNRGYPRGFAAGLLALCGAIGIIIPPSIPMIVLAIICNQSVAKLFMGGLIPGLLAGFSAMAVTCYLAKKHGLPQEAPAGFAVIRSTFTKALPALLIPVFIVVGILGGILTITEVSAAVALYSFFIGKFWYKELKWKDIPGMLMNTAVMTSSVLIVLAFCGVLAWLVIYEQIPELLAEKLLVLTSNTVLLLLIIALILVGLGMFLDIIPNLMIVAPVLMPAIEKLGIDPIFFGVFMVYILGLGLATPPVGVTLFISCALAKVSYKQTLPYVIYFIGAASLLVLLFILVPGFMTWLPSYLFDR